MTLTRTGAGHALLAIFVLSGCAGLIYQAIWSHYLGLTLGHAAYAQTLVLAIFMGGMALGAWLAGRRTPQWRHLVLAYAVVELLIGVIGLVFHPVFVGYTELSQNAVLPALGAEWLARSYQWLSAALLIAPQSILLGATFPLLSAGYLRLAPEQDGQVLGGLYFTNSIGAAAGALIATFVLLPAIGMPGAVVTAGVLNIVVAMLSWLVWRNLPEDTSVPVRRRGSADEAGKQPPVGRLLVAAAFITGATSFFYEIAWVRLLNMALGTTMHSFELMLAAFILGLAMGGYWVRRRSAHIRDAIAYAAYAQVLMGIAAFLSALVFANSFAWIGWMMAALRPSSEGYTVFSLGSAGVALLVMFPAAFFAGMTLPLFTMALLRAGSGESVIGRIYAANTLGAIVGVILIVHVATPLFGLRLSLWLAALVDVLLGVYLLRLISPARWTVPGALAAALALAVGLATLYGGKADPRILSAGVFRTGVVSLDEDVTVAFMRDGKTATVSVAAAPDGSAIISTNGKPDASLMLSLAQAPRSDEITMLMAGALPLLMHPDPRHIAVIGWGSGLTTHTLLGSATPELVETIEIEVAMHEGASLFGERVARAYQDPRSLVRFEDARTYFATSGRRFDVVVSEPSNPWVSGVASLFTREFYTFIAGHLEADGMLVQWLQSYELNDRLLVTMAAALLEVFPQVDMYVTNTWDLLLVARQEAGNGTLHWERLQEPPLAGELARVGLAGPGDFSVRYIGDARVLATMAAMYGATPHSDFYPVVSLQAPRARFMSEFAGGLQALVDNGLPVLDALGVRSPAGQADRVQPAPHSRFATAHHRALDIADALRVKNVPAQLYRRAASEAASLANLLTLTRASVFDAAVWSAAVTSVASVTVGLLPASDLHGAWIDPAWASDIRGREPVARAVLDAYEATALRDGIAMQVHAEAVLELGPGGVADPTREHMLVIAMLGAALDGQPGRMVEVDERLGKDVRVDRQGFVLSFLRAWALTRGSNGELGRQ